MNENVKMKSITSLNTVSGRKQMNFGATLFLLANNLIFNHFIQLWRYLKLKIIPWSKQLALSAFWAGKIKAARRGKLMVGLLTGLQPNKKLKFYRANVSLHVQALNVL